MCGKPGKGRHVQVTMPKPYIVYNTLQSISLFNYFCLFVFHIFIPPLIEWGLYCNHLVRLSVRSHFRNRYLSFYWKKWFYIWYMALAWWLVPCLPFSGLPHIYFLFTVRLTNERVGVFLARRSVQHLVGSPMVIHKQTIKYLNIFASTQNHIISKIYFLSDKSFQQKIKQNLPSPMLLGNGMILLGLSNVPQSLLSKLLTFILSVIKTDQRITDDVFTL